MTRVSWSCSTLGLFTLHEGHVCMHQGMYFLRNDWSFARAVLPNQVPSSVMSTTGWVDGLYCRLQPAAATGVHE